MGVDYYTCNRCEDTFPDCGSYTGCECGVHWCCDECADTEGYREEEDGFTPEGSTWEQGTSCNYCRKEDFSDYQILEFAISLLSMTREGLIEKYKASKSQ